MALGMYSAWDALRKLEWEISVYKSVLDAKDPPSETLSRDIRRPMYAAINASITGWHLVEWVWYEIDGMPECKAGFLGMLKLPENSDLRKIKEEIRRVPEFNAAHQIAHASKHSHLTSITDGFSTPVYLNFWEGDDEIYLNQTAHIRLEHEEGISEQTIYSFLNTIHRWWLHVLVTIKLPEK
jgi:hypothetical protein